MATTVEGARRGWSERTLRRVLALMVVVGALVTIGGAYFAYKPRGVYWSRVDVQFLVPYSSVNPNVIKASSQSLVMTAGAVARVVDPSGGKERLADQNVTLASEGIRHGWAVTLPNSGSQFTTSFADPLVQVEVVGTTPDEVLGQMHVLLQRVQSTLAWLQGDGTVPKHNRISLLDSPSSPPLYFQANRRSRAVLAVLALGTGLTIVARILVRRVAQSRMRKHRPPRPAREVRQLEPL